VWDERFVYLVRVAFALQGGPLEFILFVPFPIFLAAKSGVSFLFAFDSCVFCVFNSLKQPEAGEL
jgi:hypothetical protein